MPEFLKNRVVQVVLAVLAVAVVVVGAVFVLGPSGDRAGPAATAAPAPDLTATATASTPAETPSDAESTPTEPPPPSPAPPTCTNFTGDMETPTKFVVERMGVNSPMIVVGNDADGNPAAPPPAEPYTTAWYNRSPAPGTTQGNVILTIHTYSKGQALGNDLYGKNGLTEDKEGLQVGDLIKISDAQGRQVCYRYTGNTKVWVKTYDPASGVFHNPDGPPQLAIMVCWDFVQSTRVWDSRIIFYASLIPEGTPV